MFAIKRVDMKIKTNLAENSSLFKFGGTVGRKIFFLNYIKILLLAVVALIPAVITSFMSVIAMADIPNSGSDPFIKKITFAAHILSGILLLILFIFLIVNHYKRLRDIRGTTSNQLLIQTLLTLFLIIPFFGFLLLLFPGKKSD